MARVEDGSIVSDGVTVATSTCRLFRNVPLVFAEKVFVAGICIDVVEVCVVIPSDICTTVGRMFCP